MKDSGMEENQRRTFYDQIPRTSRTAHVLDSALEWG